MSLQEDFIYNMRRLRKERRLTQEKLAELCDTETCYIGQIETQRRFPSFALIEKIAEALGVEAYTMFIPEKNVVPIPAPATPGLGIKKILSNMEKEIKSIIEKL